MEHPSAQLQSFPSVRATFALIALGICANERCWTLAYLQEGVGNSWVLAYVENIVHSTRQYCLVFQPL